MKVDIVPSYKEIAMKGIGANKIIRRPVRQLKADIVGKTLFEKVELIDSFYQKNKTKSGNTARLAFASACASGLCALGCEMLEPLPGALISFGGFCSFSTLVVLNTLTAIKTAVEKKQALKLINDYIGNTEFIDTINKYLKKTGNPEITAEEAKNKYKPKDIIALYLKAAEYINQLRS